MEALTDLRKHVQGSKFVIGMREVTKLLKDGKLAKVFTASNCPESSVQGLKQSCEAAGCELVELAVPNDELGVLCKKPFYISAVGILR